MLVSLETSIQSAHPSISVSKTGDSAQWRYWSSSIDPCISVIHSRSTNHMICQNSPRTSRVLWYHLEGIWQLIFAPGGMVKLKSQIYGSMNLSMLLLSAPYASALSSVSARWLEAIRETWYSTTLFFFFFFEGGAVVGGLVLWRSRSLVSGTLCWLMKLFLHLFVALFFIFYFFCAKKGELKPSFPHSAHPAPLRRPTRRKLSVTSLKRESKEEAPANEETLFRKNCFSEWFLFSRVRATFLRKHYASSANFSSFACCKKRFVKQRVYPGAS